MTQAEFKAIINQHPEKSIQALINVILFAKQTEADQQTIYPKDLLARIETALTQI